MSTPDTPDAFVAPQINNVADLINTISVAEDAIPRKVAELDAVLEILNTPPWTPDALELDHNLVGDAANHSRLDVCALELNRHKFIGRRPNGTRFEGYTNHDPHALQDSPFWVCATSAKCEALYCMEVHQGRWRQSHGNGLTQLHDAAVVLANTREFTNIPIPKADKQVRVAYSLVTLLYATFNIPVPTREASPRWAELPVYSLHTNREKMQAFECLDLTQGSNDKYALKENLHNNSLKIQDIGFGAGHPFHRYVWVRRPIMPWPGVLAELVGYTKYAESLVPDADKPEQSVLQEMLAHCTRERQRLQAEHGQRTLERLVATFGLAKLDHDTRERERSTQKQTLRLLHVRMQSVINT